MDKLPSHIFEQIKRIAKKRGEVTALLEETNLITQVSAQHKKGKDAIEIEDFLARTEQMARPRFY